MPEGLLIVTGGSAPAVTVARPVKVWLAGPSISRLAVPAPAVDVWVRRAPGGEGARPVQGAGGQHERAGDGHGRAGGDRCRRPKIDVVECLVSGDSAPGEHDQRAARIQRAACVSPACGGPDRAGQGKGPRRLVDRDRRERTGRDRGEAVERLICRTVDQQAGGPAGEGRGLVDRPLGGQDACPIDRPGGHGQAAADAEGCPGGKGRRHPDLDVVEDLVPRDRAAGQDERRGARVERPGGIGPAAAGPDRAGQGEGARWLGDRDRRERPGRRRRSAGERLVGGPIDQQARGPAVIGRRLADRSVGGECAGTDERAIGQGQQPTDDERVPARDGLGAGRVPQGVERLGTGHVDRGGATGQRNGAAVVSECAAAVGEGARDGERPGCCRECATRQRKRTVHGECGSPADEGAARLAPAGRPDRRRDPCRLADGSAVRRGDRYAADVHRRVHDRVLAARPVERRDVPRAGHAARPVGGFTPVVREAEPGPRPGRGTRRLHSEQGNADRRRPQQQPDYSTWYSAISSCGRVDLTIPFGNVLPQLDTIRGAFRHRTKGALG